MDIDQSLIEKTLQALEKNGFETQHFANREAAVAWILSQVEAGQIAAFGGSKTTRQLNLPELMRERGLTVLDKQFNSLTPEAKRQLSLDSFTSDIFFCSANAILEEGWIFNCDGTGSRIAASIFGPKKVFIVAGYNKLASGLDGAEERLQQVGPKISRQNGRDTPCTTTGICTDCDNPDRPCRIYVLMKRPSRSIKTTVVLIDEELGW